MFESRYLPIDIGSYPWELCEDTENVHPWWIWGYWISPLSYAQNAITVNEFLAPRWDKPYSNTTTLGREILSTRGVFERGYWYWLGVGALFAYSILFNLLFCFFIKVLNRKF
jgi:hypothetical protein